MGRATIIGGGTDGLFTVDLDYGAATRDAMVFVLGLRIAELTALIAEQSEALELAEANTAAARELANIAVQEYADAARADPGGNHSALLLATTRTTAEVSRTVAIEVSIRVKRDLLKADRTGQQKEKGALESAVVSATKAVWCVDLTEAAGGTVATIDIPGEDQALLLAPGCRAPTAADGKLLAREVMSPAQAFFNAAILPGWQKWMPTYRKGTLTALNKDTDRASVALDAATSSADGLAVNQAAALSNVPVVYMTCNAEAFDVGSRVVVEFIGMAQEDPRVIGFVDHPKTCTKLDVVYLIATIVMAGTGYIMAPSPIFSTESGHGPFMLVQQVFKGSDCDPVFITNSDILGNDFISWSDGNGSPSRHDLEIQAAATYTATFYRTPAELSVDMVPSVSPDGAFPFPISRAALVINGEGFDLIENPPIRIHGTGFAPAGDPPPGFYDFSGESIVIGALAGGTYLTVSFIVNRYPSSGGVGFFHTATRV